MEEEYHCSRERSQRRQATQPIWQTQRKERLTAQPSVCSRRFGWLDADGYHPDAAWKRSGVNASGPRGFLYGSFGAALPQRRFEGPTLLRAVRRPEQRGVTAALDGAQRVPAKKPRRAVAVLVRPTTGRTVSESTTRTTAASRAKRSNQIGWDDFLPRRRYFRVADHRDPVADRARQRSTLRNVGRP